MNARRTQPSKLPLLRVGAVHVAVILVIWLSAKIQSCRNEPVQLVHVKLSASAPKPPAEPAPAETAPPNPTPTAPPTPAPPKPEPPKPDVPKPAPPKPTPPTPPKPTQPKPTVKPTPPPEPQKPAWKPRSAEEIRAQYSSHSTPSKPPQQTTSAPQPTQTRSGPSREDVARRLANAVGSASVSAPVGGELPPRDYFDQIMSVLYSRWRTPTSAEAPDGTTVAIRLSIDRSGRLTAGSITRASGNAAMDHSVRALLAAGLEFPPLPDSVQARVLDVTVALRLQN